MNLNNETSTESAEERKKLERRDTLMYLQKFRPMDDEFIRAMLRDNKPLAEMILKILINDPGFVLETFETQADMKFVTGARSIMLDGYGTDGTGRKIDLEVQRADKGAEPERARYHASVMDVENLKAGQNFRELPDVYVIFITEVDFFGNGNAVCPIYRINTATGKEFNDRSFILYINGEYRGDDDLGKLMHDFNCTKADDMYFPEMAEQTRYLKETEEGVEAMSSVVDEMRERYMQEGMIEGIKEGRSKGLDEGIIGAIEMLREDGKSDEEILSRVTAKYSVEADYVRSLMGPAA